MLSLILNILYGLLVVGVIFIILVDNGDSGRKFAWLLIITILPPIGVVLYLLFGLPQRSHFVFRRRYRKAIEYFRTNSDPAVDDLLKGHGRENLVREDFRPLAMLMSRGACPTVSEGNDVEIITEGQRKFDLLCRDIRNARESIHMEYYHFGNDTGSRAVKDLLMQKAREGVKVRFLHENIANFPIPGRYYYNMKKAGVEVVKFTNPRNHILNLITSINYRNHRKIVIIDSKIGYTGGMNINDHYFHQWRDTHLRITGPAVASLQYIFLSSWVTGKGTLDRPFKSYFPSADGFDAHVPTERSLHGKLIQTVPDEPDSHWPMIRMKYEWVLNNAKKYIWFQTPYFVPPESVLSALKSAGLRGVDVRLMLPEVPDNFLLRPANRAYYEEVLQAGVKIYLKKQFIHAKTFVSDDYISCIGSANMDCRSFDINYEVNTIIYDEETAALNRQIFLDDLHDCRELLLSEWEKRPWYNRILRGIFRLFSPLL